MKVFKQAALIIVLAVFATIALARSEGLYNPSSNAVGDYQGIDSNKPIAPGFQGLGDIKTSWYLEWGTRAFSAATRGNKLLNICNSTGGTDVLCADASSDATTGQLVIPGSLASFCPGANCTIQTFYEQTGNNNCSVNPCHMTSSVISARAVLTANALGTRSCGIATATTTYIPGASATVTTLAQPFSVSAVAKPASTADQFYLGTGGGGGVGVGISSANFALFGSSVVNGAAADTSAHAFQNILATTSSLVAIDGVSGSTGSSGGQSLTGTIFFSSDAFGRKMTGALCEVGINSTAFSGADITNINTNQHSSANGYNF